MDSINSLLNINMEVLRDFPLLANQVVDHQMEKVLNRNTRRLQLIEEAADDDATIKPNKQSIEEVIAKVHRCAKDGESLAFSIHDLRIVSYYMMKLQGDNASFECALALLRANWKNMFFNGLVFYLLNSWNMMNPVYREKVCNLVKEKLANYQDKNRRYLKLKNHADYFDDNGPMRMAALVAQQNLNLPDAPEIIGYKGNTFALSFYSDVVVDFFKKQTKIDVDEIEAILEKHSLDRTKKLLCANLVIKADRTSDDLLQKNVSRLARRVLGEISVASTWAPFTGATSEDVDKLRKAKTLVNQWYARRVIEVFFEVCVQDKERRDFWLKQVERNNVRDFRVVGSTTVKRSMQNDPRTSGMMNRYFVETNSTYSQTAALILCIKNKVLIEFSDTGALYVYNPTRSVISFINRGIKSIDSTNDLKIPSIGALVEQDAGYYYFQDEGRLTHRGNWQMRLNAWMQEKLFKYSVKEVTFSDGVDDKVFKAKPVDYDDVPEYEFASKPKPQPVSTQSTTRPITYSQPSRPTQSSITPSKPVTNSNPVGAFVEFESYVNPKISSKWFFEDRCRVIADDKAFYLAFKTTGKYAKLAKMKIGQKPFGSIWIKRPSGTPYNEIVHAYSGRESRIGYIRIKKDHIVFCESLDATEYKNIKMI